VSVLKDIENASTFPGYLEAACANV